MTLKALQLVEEDYLGGLGSRGGGKVAFHVKKVYARDGKEYRTDSFDELNPQPEPPSPEINPQPEPPGVRLTDAPVDQITNWVNKTFADVSD